MKSFEILMVLATVLTVSIVVSGQRFGTIEINKIPTVLKNRALVKSYVNCFVAKESDAVTLCDRTGKQIRNLVPKAIERGDCPDNCTALEKQALATALDIFIKDYPQEMAQLRAHYKATPEQIKQLEDWIAKNKVGA